MFPLCVSSRVGSSRAPGGWNNGVRHSDDVLQARAKVKNITYMDVYGLGTAIFYVNVYVWFFLYVFSKFVDKYIGGDFLFFVVCKKYFFLRKPSPRTSDNWGGNRGPEVLVNINTIINLWHTNHVPKLNVKEIDNPMNNVNARIENKR